jgi:nucleotide-binding universal stress UspA family protein
MDSGRNYRRTQVAEQFHRARRQAAVESLLARLSGSSTDLLSYNEVVDKLGVSGQSPGGLRQIPVSAIVGSVSRYQDFTRTFLPRNEADEDRWVSVGSAASVIGDLPPIECYKVGDNYFVLDGNHRVSIAKQQGVDYIDAYVTEVRTRAPLPAGARPDDLIAAAEYAAFLKATRLDDTRGVDMRVSVPGQYRHLESHIEAFRYRLESESGGDLSFEAAAARWYDAVYLPLVEAIREQGILRYFPGRTETDFFIWLARHRADLENALGQPISPEVAVARLLPQVRASEQATKARPSPLRRLTQLVVPDRLPATPPNWAAERILARYSEHLFAAILLPCALGGATTDDELWPALDRAVGLSLREGAQLNVLALVEPAESEPPALAALRARLAEEQQANPLAYRLDVARGDPAQRAIERAFVSDLVVLNRSYGRATAGEATPTAAARRILSAARRPVLFAPVDDRPLARQGLLVHDTRRKYDEAVFLAAYLAEQWRIALAALPISNGRNTAAVTARIRDYLALHEVSAPSLEPARPTKGLAEAILTAAAEVEADLIIMPGPGPGRRPEQHPRLDETILTVLQRWPGAVLVAG